MNFSHLKVIIILISFIPAVSLAQDIHFSQVQKAPLHLNSAQTGIFEGNIRLTGLYRNQWYKIDHPFTTMQLSVDAPSRFMGRQIGIGGIFIHDQATDNYLNTDKFLFSLSHSFFYQNHQFIVGLQPGVTLKTYDRNRITFGSQFDPNSNTFDPDSPSSEEGLSDELQYFDLNAALYWRAKINNKLPSAGISLQHINQPVESFYNNSDNNRVAITYNLHGSIVVPIGEQSDIEPLLYYSTNLSVSELLLGGTYGYRPTFWQPGVQKLSVYSVLRLNPFSNTDAFVIGGSVKVLNFDIGISYDFNVSELRKASSYQGAYEVSIIYITNRKRKTANAEPCFMM